MLPLEMLLNVSGISCMTPCAPAADVAVSGFFIPPLSSLAIARSCQTGINRRADSASTADCTVGVIAPGIEGAGAGSGVLGSGLDHCRFAGGACCSVSGLSHFRFVGAAAGCTGGVADAAGVSGAPHLRFAGGVAAVSIMKREQSFRQTFCS